MKQKKTRVKFKNLKFVWMNTRYYSCTDESHQKERQFELYNIQKKILLLLLKSQRMPRAYVNVPFRDDSLKLILALKTEEIKISI